MGDFPTPLLTTDQISRMEKGEIAYIVLTRGSKKQKRTYSESHKSLFLLVRPAGFEPATYGLEVRFFNSLFCDFLHLT